FIELDEAGVSGGDSEFILQLAQGRNRPDPHVAGIHAGGGGAHDARQRLQAVLLHERSGGEHHGGRAVGDAGRIRGGNGSGLREDRRELRHFFQGGTEERVLVARDHLRALFALDGDGRDFVIEPAAVNGALSTLLRAQRKLVLLLARDVILLGQQ